MRALRQERIDAKVAELRSVRREVTKVMEACGRGRCVFADPPTPVA